MLANWKTIMSQTSIIHKFQKLLDQEALYYNIGNRYLYMILKNSELVKNIKNISHYIDSNYGYQLNVSIGLNCS